MTVPTRTLVLAVAILAALPLTGRAADPLFERDVLPILRENCATCHGGIHKRGKLDLRTLESALRGGGSGPVIVPGKPEESLLWKHVSAGEMPKNGTPLSAAEKSALRDWIAAGAKGVTADATPAPAKPTAAADVAAAIDRVIDRALAEKKIAAAPPAGDDVFLRRAALDLTGRPLPPEKAAAFLDAKNAGKRAKLIDELLADPGFGRHQATYWHNTLIPITLNTRTVVAEFHHWLADGFNTGRGWDKTASEIVTATGDFGENPAIAFFAANGTGKEAGLRLAQAFLGVRLECAECHHHPTARWSQENYWGLIAFSSRVQGARVGSASLDRHVMMSKITESVPTGGGGLAIYKSLPPNGAIKIPADSAVNANKVVKPRFLDNEVPELGSEPPYRPALAAWMTAPKNRMFARSTVNRIWAQCFGTGLMDPIDDLDDSRQPVHPEVLDLLCRELIASRYDVRHVLRCVTNTAAYRRAGATKADRAAKNHAEAVKLFAFMPLKVVQPESLLDTTAIAVGAAPFKLPKLADLVPPSKLPPDPKKPNPLLNGVTKCVIAMTPRNAEINQLLPPGDDTGAVDYRYGIIQELRLMNGGPFAGDALAIGLAKLPGEPAAVIELLYLRTLNRRPTEKETQRLVAHVKKQPSAGAGYADVLWVLLNSAEFVTVP